MGKFSDLLYEQQIELHEGLEGEPTPEEFEDLDTGDKISAKGFDYYTRFDPSRGEEKEIYQAKGKFVNMLRAFHQKWFVEGRIDNYSTDPIVEKIINGYGTMIKTIYQIA